MVIGDSTKDLRKERKTTSTTGRTYTTNTTEENYATNTTGTSYTINTTGTSYTNNTTGTNYTKSHSKQTEEHLKSGNKILSNIKFTGYPYK